MSTKPLLLEGHVQDRETAELDALRDRVTDLEAEVAVLKIQLKSASRESANTIARLLSPLYKALKPIFGDMEPAADFAEERGGNSSAWDAVKQRLAPRLREAIDILLLQGSMKRTQLASALKMDYSNCTKNVVGILLRQGWLVDNGGNLSLKEL